MALSREGRMLILILAFGVGSVVALSWMASRYSEIYEQRNEDIVETPPASPPPATQSVDSEPAETLTPEERRKRAQLDALTELDRYLGVRNSVRIAADRLAESSPSGLTEQHRPILMAHLERELRHQGIDRQDYDTLDSLYRSWSAGADIPQPFVAAFKERASSLEAADWSAHPLLEPHRRKESATVRPQNLPAAAGVNGPID